MAECILTPSTVQVKNNNNQIIFDAGQRMPSILATYSGTHTWPQLTASTAWRFLDLQGPNSSISYYKYDGGGFILGTPGTILGQYAQAQNTKVLMHVKITDNINYSQAKVPGMSGNWTFGNSVIYRTIIVGNGIDLVDTGKITWIEMLHCFMDASGIYLIRKVGIARYGANSGSEFTALFGSNATPGFNTWNVYPILGEQLSVDYKIHICKELQ